ncbi:STAS domain-containing protein [Actinomadura gamaensis]|uniref:STAS domain-containing protein n=1 Tax=Actinomadura gamaensis TaxID=1763541 RepID=A0ABV9U1W9_9ACTN
MTHRHLPDGVTLIAVAGVCDSRNAGHLARYLHGVRRSPEEQLVLDLTEVTRIDGSGLRVLIDAHLDALSHHAAVRLAAVGSGIAEALDGVPAEARMPLHPTVEDALTAALSADPPKPPAPQP